MATWAAVRTEVARIHQFPGVVAAPRKTGASTYELWVKDSRQLAQNQIAAAGGAPGAWLTTTTASTATIIT